jgi:hypothetical protein
VSFQALLIGLQKLTHSSINGTTPPHLEKMKMKHPILSISVLALGLMSGCGKGSSGAGAEGAAVSQAVSLERFQGTWETQERNEFNEFKDTIVIQENPRYFSHDSQSAQSLINADGTTDYAEFCHIKASTTEFSIKRVEDIAADVRNFLNLKNEQFVLIAEHPTVELVQNPKNSSNCDVIVSKENAMGPAMYLGLGFDESNHLLQGDSVLFRK